MSSVPPEQKSQVPSSAPWGTPPSGWSYEPPAASVASYGYGAAAAPPPAANHAPASVASVASYGYGAAPPSNPRTALAVQVECFNSILKKLTCDLVVRYPADAKIDRAKKRIMLAIDIDPILILDMVGPYLYKFRDGIYAGDADFFIENDYDAELRESVDADKADITAYIIPKVKTAWGDSGPVDRAAYTETVQALLDAYIEYLSLKLAE